MLEVNGVDGDTIEEIMKHYKEIYKRLVNNAIVINNSTALFILIAKRNVDIKLLRKWFDIPFNIEVKTMMECKRSGIEFDELNDHLVKGIN
jgi:hypothetical protein